MAGLFWFSDEQWSCIEPLLLAVSEQFCVRLATAPRSLTDEKSLPLFRQFTLNNPPDGDDVHPLSVVVAAGRGFVVRAWHRSLPRDGAALVEPVWTDIRS